MSKIVVIRDSPVSAQGGSGRAGRRNSARLNLNELLRRLSGKGKRAADVVNDQGAAEVYGSKKA